ncbi:MAG: sensor domain-containing diguanylate cyclase [Sulfurimonas sp.]
MHKLLKRQLKKTGAIVDEKFLQLISQAYVDADEDRLLLERSLEIASQEMQELYQQLQKSSQEKLEKSVDRYDSLVYELRNHYIFYAYNQDYYFTYFSDSIYNILGYTKEEATNMNFLEFLTNDPINKNAQENATLIISGEKIEPHIFSVYHKDRSRRYLELNSYPIFNEDEDIWEVKGVARDITAEYEAQQKLHYISNHDKLTGLVNRYSLYNTLEYIIADSARNQKTFALLYIDLDEFKSVNDTLGHVSGDILLQKVTKRVQNEIRKNDIFARIGGDEFVIILTNVESSFISKISRNILNALKEPFKIHTNKVTISVSIGIAIYPKNGEDIDTLLNNADKAMYMIKKDGKNNFTYS